MREYKPLTIKKYSKKSYKNPEARRFKRFKEDKSADLKLTCNDVRICAGNTNLATFFVFDTIYHYDMLNDNLITKYPQSKDLITVGNVRRDGKLIYTGLSNGKINVYDAHKKNLLRTYNQHKLQVNSIDISENLVNFVSSSNDLSFRMFDLAQFQPVLSFEKAHKDYIKAAKFLDENLIITGGYDKVVKVWDIRNDKKAAVKKFSNVNICNDLLILKSKDKFVSTSENFLNLFDLRTDKLVLQSNPVQSNITRLVTDKNQSRLFVVAPNENFVKVVDLESLTFRSLYSIKLGKEISAFDVSSDMNRYAVAYTSGEIAIRSRNVDEDEEDIYKDQEEKDFELLDPTKHAKKDLVKNYKYFNRGQYEDNLEDNELALPKEKKRKLQEYDVYLKKFQYHSALDSVLKKNNVELLITVLEELIDRNALKLALLNRSEEDLEILLKFILWKIRDPKTMNVLLYVFNLVVDYYMIMFGKNKKIDSLFNQISEAIKEEISFEKRLLQLNSKIESVNTVSNFSY